jgi:hypothetical protein
MVKVVINRCFGGFGLSDQALELFMNKKSIEFEKVLSKSHWKKDEFDYYRKGHVGEDEHYLWYYDLCQDRSDPALIEVVEELGEKANGWAAELGIVEIPDDVEWDIVEYDGKEHVAEKHRTWY